MSSSVPWAPSNRIAWPRACASVEHQRHVAHPRLQPLARPCSRSSSTCCQSIVAVADQAVAGGDVLADGVCQSVARPVGEVADADAAAGDLVLVGRADAARRRADLALAAARFGQHVELAVIRQDQVRLVADEQAIADVDAEPGQLVDLGEQRLPDRRPRRCR